LKRTFFLCCLILFLVVLIFPKSVKFVKSIELGKGTANGKITKFLFGKKKINPVKPSSVFFINEVNLGITDQLNGLVLVINKKGKVLKRIRKSGKMSFLSPVSGSSDGSGGFYISDSSLRLILQFSEKYKFKKLFISDQRKRITGIAFFENKLFCVDTENHNVIIYNDKGIEILKFGRRGSGKGTFNYPTHLAVDKDTIYINDSLNFRVQMFDHEGKFKSMFGKNGKRGGDFSKPKGIAIDSKKRIFVTDVMFDTVQVFDTNGRFLSYFGGPGNSEGKFWMPSGIMINKDDSIYIADTYNSRCQVFKVVDEVK